jgi:hypothetical protein
MIQGLFRLSTSRASPSLAALCQIGAESGYDAFDLPQVPKSGMLLTATSGRQGAKERDQ